MADAQLVENEDGSWLLQGELDFTSVLSVLRHDGVYMRGKNPLTVDLKGVTRSDSAGLALLLQWSRDSEIAGNSIEFVNVPAQLLSIARVCGLDDILSLH